VQAVLLIMAEIVLSSRLSNGVVFFSSLFFFCVSGFVELFLGFLRCRFFTVLSYFCCRFFSRACCRDLYLVICLWYFFGVLARGCW